MPVADDLPKNQPLPVSGQAMEPLGEGAVRLWAPAKINLNLLVGPRRQDGFHPLDSYVARVSLYDRIELRRRRDGKVRLDCRGFDCGPEKNNLALRAVKATAEGQCAGGVDILLEKHIPPGRGLGGGSSDAAAVLRASNELWQLGLGHTDLLKLASGLGSDVPFFLGPPAARMTGRGEQIQPTEVHPFLAVLILPEFSCPTAEVYNAFDKDAVPMPRQLDPTVLVQPPSQWRERLINQLEAPAVRVAPPLGQLLRRLRECLSLPVHLTGSGSAVFVLCDERQEATQVLRQMPKNLRSNCIIVQNTP